MVFKVKFCNYRKMCISNTLKCPPPYWGDTCRHLHFILVNMGHVFVPPVELHLSSSPWGWSGKEHRCEFPHVHSSRCCTDVSNLISLEKQNKIAHMGNEAVHRVVCSLTDRALPKIFLLLFVLSLNTTHLKGRLPGQILLSSSESG